MKPKTFHKDRKRVWSALAFSVAWIFAQAFAVPYAFGGQWSLPEFRWRDPFAPCNGNCAVHVSFGKFHGTEMTRAMGFDPATFSPDAGDYIAPWDYDYKDSFLVSGTASRRVLTFGDLISVEMEAGIGQRLGKMHATEVWGAMYLRWHAFPWNEYIRTTIACSTGLSYATKIEDLERLRDDDDVGAHLLHYLSPEVTFALPGDERRELVLRFHHRSGGGAIFGDTALFGGVTGGANYATVGFRYRF